VTPQKPKLRTAGPRAATRAAARTAPKPGAKPSPAAIDKARSQAMALIERRRDRDGNAFLNKARLLLTRHWAKADWAARATLLKTAGWLIRVAANPAPRVIARRAGKAGVER
jgi:predicted lipid-binding transport protein (Tim44 family)